MKVISKTFHSSHKNKTSPEIQTKTNKGITDSAKPERRYSAPKSLLNEVVNNFHELNKKETFWGSVKTQCNKAWQMLIGNNENKSYSFAFALKRKKEFLDYDKAKELINKLTSRGINLSSHIRYTKFIKELNNLPSNAKSLKYEGVNLDEEMLEKCKKLPSTPDRDYKGKGWKGYGDFLGIVN
ncbi:MAG: hypothetical protein QNJ31_08620 [Candidatus Caenarcaniphilales bacterium]|nr:hypothetical protein [Candidatus Caenarcaniphilales bacterium]